MQKFCNLNSCFWSLFSVQTKVQSLGKTVLRFFLPQKNINQQIRLFGVNFLAITGTADFLKGLLSFQTKMVSDFGEILLFKFLLSLSLYTTSFHLYAKQYFGCSFQYMHNLCLNCFHLRPKWFQTLERFCNLNSCFRSLFSVQP